MGSQSRRTESRPGSIQSGPLLLKGRRCGEGPGGGGEVVSQSRRTEVGGDSIQLGRLLQTGQRPDEEGGLHYTTLWRAEGSGGGGEMVSQGRRAESRQGAK